MSRRTKDGKCRQWVQCRKCGWVGYYDYVPYGLVNPPLWLGCGHGIGQCLDEAAKYITAKQANAAKKKAASKEKKGKR